MVDTGTKAQLQQAKALIQAKKFSQARKLLKKIDSPTAHKWLAQLDEIAPETEKPNRILWGIGGLVLVAGVGLVAFMAVSLLLPLLQSAIAPQNELEPPPLELVPVSAANATSIPGATSQMMMYQPPQQWYCQGGNFRSCPQLNDDCDEGRVLVTGQPVLVLGEVEGETWLNSRKWYYGEVDGERGFIHSEFITVTSSRPTSTPAPPQAQWASEQNTNHSSSNGGETTASQPNPTRVPVCDCNGNVYNCSDFRSQRDAQACYDYCVSMGRDDVHHMDGDNNGRGDGIACERMR